MTLTVTDSASALLYWLKTSDSATAIRALVQGGESNIFEAGDLTVGILTEAQSARRTAGDEDTKILALSVHDAGEETHGQVSSVQHVVIRLFDRDRGYRNIRTVRDLIRNALTYDLALDAAEAGGETIGFLNVVFVGRTGYRRSVEYAADFEALTYSSLIQSEEDD